MTSPIPSKTMFGTDGVINMMLIEDNPAKSLDTTFRFEIHASIAIIGDGSNPATVITAADQLRGYLRTRKVDEINRILKDSGKFSDAASQARFAAIIQCIYK